MTAKTMLVTGLVLLLAGSCVLAGPAQEILGSLADDAKGERMISGFTSLGLGVGLGVGSYLLLGGSGLEIYGVITGGLFAVQGAITLLIPTPAELACRQSCDSEMEAAMALEEMAYTARFSRYVSGVVNIAAGTVSLLFPYSYLTPYDYVYSAIVSYGMAVMDFIFPSKEERAYNQYKLAVGAG